ncbi:ABC transporter ATP-binding protein [Thermococcus celer]|uniref:Daunorubicin ABC transporter ATP-binding protein n=1 Tax=Thermococcus celer Vu 13 = JCM 8558 TaxID=1293037 RepID=A0A218P0I3_THECE|nr:ABC transporter ATP-binding protein [Thermococcus celer]ASI98447.1 daunorubicin ABC transporter ATP-binding protein [Thermococcus celer Vu 13 = JCM 8558]
MSIVELKNVVKSFSGPQGNIVAVNNLSFQAKESGVLGILGPNGAGKTTTLRMIATIYKPDRGTIMVDGIDVLKEPLKVRSKIAYMPQEPDLIPSLSVEDHITYYLRFRGFDKKEAKKCCEEALRSFNLEKHRNKKPFQLSTGLKRRVQLASVLSAEAPVIFLDEPTTGLDPMSKRNTWELIKDRIEDSGATILLTSHDLYEVEYLANRVIIINNGRLIAEGTPRDLRKKFGKSVKVVFEDSLSFDALRGELMGVEGVKDISQVSENAVEIKLDSIDRSINNLVRVLASKELQIKDIITTAANFEDVYLEILGGEI